MSSVPSLNNFNDVQLVGVNPAPATAAAAAASTAAGNDDPHATATTTAAVTTSAAVLGTGVAERALPLPTVTQIRNDKYLGLLPCVKLRRNCILRRQCQSARFKGYASSVEWEYRVIYYLCGD